jgi:DNA modification methylase
MNRIEFGDCRTTMRRWASEGVKAQMCVTSPPYFGLRDYGHEGQIGLEETPEQYITAMVEVFRCIWDVLADDGTLWLNIGDSYATGTTASRQQGSRGLGAATQSAQDAVARIGNPPGCKTKDLIGIPWMLAFALRSDGWYLRQDIIWHKPNPMPESVKDRCTKAHEYIFLLSKSERYFFDAEAMKEEAVGVRGGAPKKIHSTSAQGKHGATSALNKPWDGAETRNRRSVWTVATKPYAGAHFATFPPALIEPCILAGSRPGDVVLDPFMGSGTTAQVSESLGRQYIGCELNEDYKALQEKRLAQPTLC